jgi:4-hydroxybenzoate polyprenyltransferase
MEYKEYKYKRITFLAWFLIAFIFFILAFIGYYLEGTLVSKILGVISFLFGLFWIILTIHAMKNPTLQTTENEIIFSELFFKNPIIYL